MALINKNFRDAQEYPVFLPKNTESVIPIGFEFEFMCGSLTKNLDINDRQTIARMGERNYLQQFFPKLYSFSGDCGFEAKSFVGPLSLHKATLTKMRFFDLPHCVDKSDLNAAGIHTSIGICDFTLPVKEKVFSFLNNPTHTAEFRALGGRPQQSWLYNCGDRARSGLWNENHNLYDRPNNIRWNRVINDSHQPNDSGQTARGNYTAMSPHLVRKSAMIRYSASGKEIGTIQPVLPWNKGWWECRLFHGRPELLLPAIEFTDAIVRVAHEGELSFGALFEYARSYPRYRNLALLMAEQLKLGDPTVKRKRGTNAKVRQGTRNGSGGQDASIGSGGVCVTNQEVYIDPAFPQVSAILGGVLQENGGAEADDPAYEEGEIEIDGPFDDLDDERIPA